MRRGICESCYSRDNVIEVDGRNLCVPCATRLCEDYIGERDELEREAANDARALDDEAETR